MKNDIVFFGGTFDPVHNGHIQMVNQVVSEVGQVIISPAYSSPHKVGKKSAEGEHRKAMLELVFQNDPRVKVWTYEINSKGVNYTYETLDVLQKFFPRRKIHILIGMDNMECFDKWRNYEYLLDNYDPIVTRRAGYEDSSSEKPHITEKCFISNGVIDGISSTDVRDKLANGEDVSDLVPESVIQYIKDNNLYS